MFEEKILKSTTAVGLFESLLDRTRKFHTMPWSYPDSFPREGDILEISEERRWIWRKDLRSAKFRITSVEVINNHSLAICSVIPLLPSAGSFEDLLVQEIKEFREGAKEEEAKKPPLRNETIIHDVYLGIVIREHLLKKLRTFSAEQEK